MVTWSLVSNANFTHTNFKRAQWTNSNDRLWVASSTSIGYFDGGTSLVSVTPPASLTIGGICIYSGYIIVAGWQGTNKKIYKSSNEGSSWTLWNSSDSENNVAFHDLAFFNSTIYGLVWNSSTSEYSIREISGPWGSYSEYTSATKYIYSAPTVGGKIIAGRSGHLLFSSDRGNASTVQTYRDLYFYSGNTQNISNLYYITSSYYSWDENTIKASFTHDEKYLLLSFKENYNYNQYELFLIDLTQTTLDGLTSNTGITRLTATASLTGNTTTPIFPGLFSTY